MVKGEGPFGGRVETDLVSVQRDGSDRQVHATFPDATDVQVSADGQRVTYQEGDNVYVAPLPLAATGQEGIRLERKTHTFPITPVSLDAGMYPRWRDANTIECGNANNYSVY